MIVLDEQLMGRNLDVLISAWYPGNVVYITELRPHTIIKDEAIPVLLREQSQPTFVGCFSGSSSVQKPAAWERLFA